MFSANWLPGVCFSLCTVHGRGGGRYQRSNYSEIRTRRSSIFLQCKVREVNWIFNSYSIISVEVYSGRKSTERQRQEVDIHWATVHLKWNRESFSIGAYYCLIIRTNPYPDPNIRGETACINKYAPIRKLSQICKGKNSYRTWRNSRMNSSIYNNTRCWLELVKHKMS